MLIRPVATKLVCTLSAILPAAAFAAQDGWLDTTFGQSGRQVIAFDRGANNIEEVNGMAVLPDGRIMLAGSVQDDPDVVGIGLARLLADGQVDESFAQSWSLPIQLESARVTDLAL